MLLNEGCKHVLKSSLSEPSQRYTEEKWNGRNSAAIHCCSASLTWTLCYVIEWTELLNEVVNWGLKTCFQVLSQINETYNEFELKI